ncbi:MAG: DUF5696 domain-containing protein [Oscillospiraceae bacterium]|nr:DUF5696 domain-containing protein [Oscillospiraceae bacterium]
MLRGFNKSFCLWLVLPFLLTAAPALVEEANAAENVAAPRYSSGAVRKADAYAFENDALLLRVDPETAVMSLTQKRSGAVWSTNPPKEVLDSLNTTQKKNLASQLTVSYTDIQNNNATMDSYTESVLKKQFTVVEIENGVRIGYVIGSESLIVPQVMERTEFEGYLQKLDDTKRAYALQYYKLYRYDEVVKVEGGARVLETYPALEKMDLYDCNAGSVRIRNTLSAYFSEAGMTASAIQKAYEQVGYKETVDQRPRFELALEYTLDDRSLSVRIPTESVQYDRSVYHLREISFLKQFGAQKQGSDGYLFVPDGSGALIGLGKSTNDVYSQMIYGTDYALSQEKFGGYTERAALPIFGIKSGQSAVLGVVEENAAMGSITAGNDGQSDYLFAFCNFRVMAGEFLRMGDRSQKGMYVFTKKQSESDYSVRYFFLENEDADYSGMARCYREILFGDREPLDGKNAAPLVVKAYGAIPVETSLVGIPYTAARALTDYSEASKMTKELRDAGVDNVILRYTGWFNGGMKNSAPAKIKLIGKLGSKKDFTAMLRAVSDGGNAVFPEVNFSAVSADRWFDGFSASSDAARYLDNTLAKVYEYNAATLDKDEDSFSYAVSSDRYEPLAEKFMNAYEKYDAKDLFISGFDSALNSNFYRGKNELTRDDAQKSAEKMMTALKNRGYRLMTDYGNAYLLPFVYGVTDIPLTSSNYNMEIQSVPFLAMVLHGYAEYTGRPMNQSGNMRQMLLESVENGASLQYLLNKATVVSTKGTAYSYLFASDFDLEKENVVKAAAEMEAVLKLIRQTRMTAHVELKNGLRVVSYENGVRCVVNYQDEPLDFEGKTVSPRDYLILERAD